MATVLTDESNYEDIADAIREKNGSSNTYLPSEMAGAVRNIPTGGAVESVNGKTGVVVLDASDVGAKAVQTAKSSPSANGTEVAFIDTISQDAQGVITATKKTVREATTSQSGLMPAADKTKLNGIESGAQVNAITGVKGNSESGYRTGNVNLTPANIGAKAVQTPVSDPSSSGIATTMAFISNITQNAQGVVSPTKKTIPPASTSEDGIMTSQNVITMLAAYGMGNAAEYSFAPSSRHEATYPIKAGSIFTHGGSASYGEWLYRALVDIANANQISNATAEQIRVSDLYNELLAGILAAYPTPTASGATVSIADGSNGLPIKSLLVNIKPAQSGSGTPSPTNIRAISGWTEASIAIQHDGTEMLFVNWETEAGEVYGGTLDVTTGLLTVDRVMITIDGSADSRLASFNTSDANVNRVQSNVYNDIGVANIAFDACDKFEPIAPTTTSSLYKVWNSPSAPRMFFGLPKTVTTLDEAKAWFASNPTHVVARIASPQTYQLDPMEVLTALGENIFSADCGDVSVTYRADPTLFAAKGQTEDDMTANVPIASGKYFQIGNTLYRATAAIATGETIAPEINCVVTNLAEALNLLNT